MQTTEKGLANLDVVRWLLCAWPWVDDLFFALLRHGMWCLDEVKRA